MPSSYDVAFIYGKITEYVRMFLESPFLIMSLILEEKLNGYTVEMSKDENDVLDMIFLRENNVAVGFTLDGQPTKCIRVYDQGSNLIYKGSYECYFNIDRLF